MVHFSMQWAVFQIHSSSLHSNHFDCHWNPKQETYSFPTSCFAFGLWGLGSHCCLFFLLLTGCITLDKSMCFHFRVYKIKGLSCFAITWVSCFFLWFFEAKWLPAPKLLTHLGSAGWKELQCCCENCNDLRGCVWSSGSASDLMCIWLSANLSDLQFLHLYNGDKYPVLPTLQGCDERVHCTQESAMQCRGW